jgi:hypothetical protein
MEQNQTAPAQPVNPVVEALEKTEPVQSTPTPMQAAPAPKKKSSATMLSIVLLLILALGGIGFGVWAFMDKNDQVDKLNKQIQDLRNSTSSVTPEPDEPTGATLIADDGYIYVSEWGLKVKIADGLNYVSYSFKHSGGADQTESTMLAIWATTADTLSDFANPYKNNDSLGAIGRTKKGTYEAMGYTENNGCGMDAGLVFSDDEYNYCVEGPQVTYSTAEEDVALEVSSSSLIKTMLETEDNYSEF